MPDQATIIRVAQWLATKPDQDVAQLAFEMAFEDTRDVEQAIAEADKFLASL